MDGGSSINIFLRENPLAAGITVESASGSTPREAGTFMLVSPNAKWGTIGGGQLEHQAVMEARDLLHSEEMSCTRSVALGPEIAQCCGGRANLLFERVTAASGEALVARLEEEEQRHPRVFIFGAGHVGRALLYSLAPLPFRVTVVETRPEEVALLPSGTDFRLTPIPEGEIGTMPPGSFALILTHDHSLDFLIARAALAREDLTYIGMIGSKTKRAVFSKWLVSEAEGDIRWLDRLVSPIGGNRVRDKRPEVIAAMTAVELLTHTEP
jgi:xanthine dehydrogenase accessory factor